MKFNWGARIATLYIAFVLMIGTLVAATFRQKPLLVADDYYLRETKFQEQLDARKAAAALGATPIVRITGDSLELKLPQRSAAQRLNGTLSFYAPADPGADLVVPFETRDGVVRAAIPKRKMRYLLQIDWRADGVRYYAEVPGPWTP